MPLLQTLDDRSYADLVAEARSRIPGLYPAWTDHNPTDPGMVLVELLAWLAEMLIYRADQVPDEHYDAFLNILNGQGWSRSGPLDAAIRDTLLALRERYRAATSDDFEHLVLQHWPKTREALGLGDAGVVRRARCLPQLNLEAPASELLKPASGHVSLVIVPGPHDERDETPQPSPALCETLLKWLEPRRLLGTRHHIVGPGYVNVTISARLVLRDNYAPLTTAQSGILSNKAIIAETRRQALAAIRAYFHPLMGGPDGQGWRFGRNVYLSEIYQLLDRLPGVDFAENVRFIKPAGDRAIMAGDEVIGVRLYSHELVAIAVVDDPSDPDNFTVAIGQRPGVSQ